MESPQDASLTTTWAQLVPTRVQLGPTWPHLGLVSTAKIKILCGRACICQYFNKCVLRRPRWAPDGPQRLQRGPPLGLVLSGSGLNLRHFEAISGLWGHLGPIWTSLGPAWAHLGGQLGSFRVCVGHLQKMGSRWPPKAPKEPPFGAHLGRLRAQLGALPGSILASSRLPT